MKKLLSSLIVFLMAIVILSASVIMPDSVNYIGASYRDSLQSVAQAGRYVNSFANPAALPFTSENDGSFLLSVNYNDAIDSRLYKNDEKLPFFNTGESSLTLSFGGQNAMFTAAIGYDLENRQQEGGELTYDMLFRMHFQLDLAYAFGPFSFGGRVQGGSSLVRNDRPVESVIDFATNMLFSQFFENPGSEYFQLGMGLMWHDECFTAGIYTDRVISTGDGSVRFSLDDLTDSLSLGLSFYMPRFNSRGELILLRPAVFFQAGNITSHESYLMAGLDLCFQLLPDVNLSFVTKFVSWRDARVDYMKSTGNLSVYELEVEFGRWALAMNFSIPFEVYSGDDSRPVSFTLSMRFNS